MANPKIRIYPCEDFTKSSSRQAALRKILFGRSMKIFPGGWSYFEMSRLEKAKRSPIRSATSKKAFEVGVSYMKKAQVAWAKEKQKTELFPVSSNWKLISREAVEIRKGKLILGWRLSWQVYAKSGSGSGLSHPSVKGYIPIDNAIIVLYVALNGLVLGGNSHWRPVKRAKDVEMQLDPTDFKKEIDNSRAKYKGGQDHEHSRESTSQNSYFSISYHMGTRSEYRNFVDPYVRFVESVGHSHGPPAIAPLTAYGIFAEILTLVRQVGSKGVIELRPWINTAKGAVSTTNKEITGHWVVQGASDDSNTAPVKHKLGTLRVTGVKEVSLTVKNRLGGISHAHAEVCSALSKKPNTFNPSLPVS